MKRITKTSRPLNDFKERDGQWKEVESWPHHAVEIFCRTKDCSAKDVKHEVNMPANVDGILRTVCGICKQPTEVWADDNDQFAT